MQASILHGEASLVKRISYELSQPLEARLATRSENEVSWPLFTLAMFASDLK